MMRAKYQEINIRKEEIKKDIETIEFTIKRLVMQQLGDKSGYDSTLNDLEGPETKMDSQGNPLQQSSK